MRQLLIQQHLNRLAVLKKVSGTTRESVVREAFKDLLKGMSRSHDIIFVPEYEIETRTKERRYADGALLYELRMPFSYWEAKDEKDDLYAEIETKFNTLWAAEAEDRLAAYRRGEIRSVTLAEVLSKYSNA